MKDVIVVIGAGQIGQAIARRVGVAKHVVLADMRQDNANAAAEVLGNAGYEVSVATVDVSSREAVHALVDTATTLGDVTGLIHAAGVSPSQASPATILKVDLYGTALVLEQSTVMALSIARPGGAVGRVGVPQSAAIPAAQPTFFRNVTIAGGPAPVRAYIEELLPDVLEGRIEPGRVFDRVIDLDGVPDGYRAMDKREAIKVMIEF